MKEAKLVPLGPSDAFEVHSHRFISGPRSTAGYRNGKWEEPEFSHSHPGGERPHRHPNCGPSFYGYRKPQVTKRPIGEQLDLVPMSEEESSFELIITDSAKPMAKWNPKSGEYELPDIAQLSIEQISMPAAERIKTRLAAHVRRARRKEEAGMTKLCIVEAMFPELRGGSIYKTGKGRASSNKAAIGRAFADVLTQVKKKRIHQIKATITLTESKVAA